MTRNPKELQNQFAEQIKCLELKSDIDYVVLNELQDFYRRFAVVEQEYADALVKLVNNTKQKHVNERTKRSHWTPYSTTSTWNAILGSTLRMSQAHSVMSEVFSKQMTTRLSDMVADTSRLHKQCREIMSDCQERILTRANKLQVTHREYTSKQMASVDALKASRRTEEKVTAAEAKARGKSKDIGLSQKFQRAQSDHEQKVKLYTAANLDTIRARNKYLVQISTLNQSISRYYQDEVPDIVDCLACGFHNSLARSVMMQLSTEESLGSCHRSIAEMLNRNITTLDWRHDKSLFFKQNKSAFAVPRNFTFHLAKDDQVSNFQLPSELEEEVGARISTLKSELEQLTVSTEETWKTLEEVEKILLELINQKDYDVSRLFFEDKARRGEGSAKPSNDHSTGSLSSAKSCEQLAAAGDQQPSGIYTDMRSSHRDLRIEQEQYYLSKFGEYIEQMYRLQCTKVALYELSRAAPPSSTADVHAQTIPRVPAPSSPLSTTSAPPRNAVLGADTGNDPMALALNATPGRRVLRVPNVGKPKLFGGTIDEYVEATNQPIPQLLLSCTNLIVRLGLKMTGIFRVSGSKAEVLACREAFEHGDDPLAGLTMSRDVHLTAGLFKLYFRELGEPPFPNIIFDSLVDCVRESTDRDLHAQKLLTVVSKGLSTPVFVVMRFIFAFLKHVSEYSEKNMMDPYNLAICFGPSLIPIPPGHDQVKCQPMVINIVRTFITHHDVIFDEMDVPGPVYTGRLEVDASGDEGQSREPLTPDNFPDSNQDKRRLCTYASHDDGTPGADVFTFGDGPIAECDYSNYKLALAQFDFVAQSSREISFKQGDEIHLFQRLSDDWWEGQLASGAGPRGLVPHLYVMLVDGTASPSGDDLSHRAMTPLRDEIAPKRDAENGDASATKTTTQSTPKPSGDHVQHHFLHTHPSHPQGPEISDKRALRSLPEDHEAGSDNTAGLPDDTRATVDTQAENTEVDTAIDDVVRDIGSFEHSSHQYSIRRSSEWTKSLRQKLLVPSAKRAPDLVMDLPGCGTTTAPSTSPLAKNSGANKFGCQGPPTIQKRPSIPSFANSNPVLQSSADPPPTLPRLQQSPQADTDHGSASDPPLPPDTKKMSISDRLAFFEASKKLQEN